MKDYDTIDPEDYEKMYEVIPRENYMKVHWRPIIEKRIQKYCKRKKVLDLGCGYGRYSTIVKKSTDNIVGLDISKNWLNYLKNKNDISDTIRGDAHNIPLRDGSIEVVVTIGLFEYIERAIVVKEVRRILNLGGICMILVPNKKSAFRIVGKLIRRVLRLKNYTKEPTKKEMIELFKTYNFKLVELKMDDGLIWLPNFLDKICGKQIYHYIERFFQYFGENPFSNNILFVIEKG